MSRKAGLLTFGVRWTKYNCTRKTNTTGSYVLGAQNTLSQGWDDQQYFQGFSSYTWNRTLGTVYATGNQSFVDKDHPGVVYEDDGTGKTLYGYAARGDGFWHTFSKTVKYETETTITYTRGGLVGTVRAAEGEYPDAKKGYAYVTVYSGYTIMKDSAGNYYAYLKA